MRIYSDDKWLHYTPLALYFIQGEKNADDVEITIPKKRNDIDLTALSWRISAISADGIEVTQVLSSRLTDNHIVLNWRITEDFTAAAGDLRVVLQGVNPAGSIVIKFTGNPIHIIEDKRGNPPILGDISQQILNQIQTLSSSIISKGLEAEKLFNEATSLLDKLKKEGSILEQKTQEVNNKLAVFMGNTLPGITDIAEEILQVSKHPPRPSNENTWVIWDPKKGEYVDSGIALISGGVASILQFDDLSNFPTEGQSTILYISQKANTIHRWDSDTNKYYTVGSDYKQIKQIDGGNANG